MSKEHLKDFIGFGVAGNFADHLDQAGEASDFVNVKTKEKNAPKGIFPFYLPYSESFLGIYPLSNSDLVYPSNIGEGNLQMEPEIALICELVYENEKVVDIIPNYFTAYNDCSIRKPNAKKISEKKNWGEKTKGISSQIIPIDKFEEGGIMDNYAIASFLKRDGKVFAYGNNSPALTYNYFYSKLKKWMIEKLNTQEDFGPLEDLNTHIKNCNYPKGTIISIGATSYSNFGENTFLEVGDEIFVCVYDMQQNSYEDILNQIVSGKNTIESVSLLQQTVV
ncbi:MAG TPA: hypothetical protein ENK66_10030 [Arcobacter sp.]|jgi:hypothetical protein|nr:hypothetical protein [Arcobacter sp.]